MSSSNGDMRGAVGDEIVASLLYFLWGTMNDEKTKMEHRLTAAAMLTNLALAPTVPAPDKEMDDD